MTIAIGVVVRVLGLVCWIGQGFVFFVSEVAETFGLLEPREDLDGTFYIIKVESLGLADFLPAWTLPLSSLMMIVGASGWPLAALVAGGT
ncbi:MAG: hypothetical protein HKN63_06165 [Rhodobacteraceae bacterium]|nr:hypothetical protein [Paracoccaceae bacterium]